MKKSFNICIKEIINNKNKLKLVKNNNKKRINNNNNNSKKKKN